MPKVIINDSQGLVQKSGSGVELSSSPSFSVSALSAASTLEKGGAVSYTHLTLPTKA